jgi:hypothetical protein
MLRTSFRAAFFAVPPLGLALATGRFVAAYFVALVGLPRLTQFPLRNFAGFCAKSGHLITALTE